MTMPNYGQMAKIPEELWNLLDRNRCEKFCVMRRQSGHNIEFTFVIRGIFDKCIEVIVINDPSVDAVKSLGQYINKHYAVLYRKDGKRIYA